MNELSSAEKSEEEIVLATDGGGDGVSRGAAAAIIVLKSLHCKIKVVARLGAVNGNEAEICGGLLGFAVLQTLETSGKLRAKRVRWLSDSQYVLRTVQSLLAADEYQVPEGIPNYGFWSLLHPLLLDRRVLPEHVRAHASHSLNNACDKACVWIQQKGDVFAVRGSGRIGQMERRIPKDAWIFFDLQDSVQKLRATIGESPKMELSDILFGITSKILEFISTDTVILSGVPETNSVKT